MSDDQATVETYHPQVIEESELADMEAMSRECIWAVDWTSAKGVLDLIATIRHWQEQAFKPKETP